MQYAETSRHYFSGYRCTITPGSDLVELQRADRMDQSLLSGPQVKMGAPITVNIQRRSLIRIQCLLKSVITLLIIFSCILSSHGDLISGEDQYDSPVLVIEVLRNYQNSLQTQSGINGSSEIQCQVDVEAVLDGYAESELWAFRSE